MQRFLFVFSATMLMLYSISAEARLPDQWRELFTPGEGWQTTCTTDGGGRGGRGSACRLMSLYSFPADAEDIKPDDVIFSLTYDMRRMWLETAPYQGKCTGGEVKIDGETAFKLMPGTNGCAPQGGGGFMDHPSNALTHPISLFTKGEKMEIDMQLEDGTTITKEVSLNGFDGHYEDLVAKVNSGAADPRGGGRGR